MRIMTGFRPTPFLLLVALLSAAPEAAFPDVRIVTSKPAYYRYELVDISVYGGGMEEDPPGADTLYAFVASGDSLLRTVGNASCVPCLPTQDGRRWTGKWPVPWNPPLGTCIIEVGRENRDSLRTVLARESFEIMGRSLEAIEPGFCAMNIESTIDFLNNPFPIPFDESSTQESFLAWAEFLGADAILYSAGQTMEGEEGVTDSFPWYPTNIELFPKVAALSKVAGFKFGGWIGCYFLWGERLRELQYTYSWDYWEPSERMYRPHRVSISDEKRLSDIIDLARRLNADPNVDFVGLDYIRTGFGGYEMVDDFVREMGVEVSGDWMSLYSWEKRRWLALKIEIEKDPAFVDKWRWYCAHRVAMNIHHIIQRSGLQKPLWVFLLGWRHGREHGQDPVMFHDAGASWCSVMLYESDAEHCREMNESWSAYLDTGVVNLLVGESVDWELLQNSTDPPGPEEFYRRLTEAVDGFYNGGSVKGAFWHDLHRGARGNLGPYRRIEWAITGAAGFSYVRWKNERLPIGVTMRGPEEAPTGAPYDVCIHLINTGPEDIHEIFIEPLKVPHTDYIGSEPIRVGTLRAHTEASVTLKCRHRDDENRSVAQAMVAVRTTWIRPSPRDRFVSFTYVKRGCKNGLTK